MATKYLDFAGLSHIINKLKTRDFNGMGLSKEDFTAELKNRLNDLHTKLNDFDPSGVATDSNLSALQTKVDGMMAVINQEGTADGDKIINKLNEVFAFLSELSSDAKLKALLDSKAEKSTTLAGYGVTDAKIVEGTITLGAQSITPLTEHQDLSPYAKTADVDSAVSGKVDKVTGKGLSTNDYTAADKAQVAKIAEMETTLADKLNSSDVEAITTAEINALIAAE